MYSSVKELKSDTFKNLSHAHSSHIEIFKNLPELPMILWNYNLSHVGKMAWYSDINVWDFKGNDW
jgi:hypothetical protein